MIQLNRILAAADFSSSSGHAIQHACELAGRFQSELHLLHVLEVHATTTPMFAGGLAISAWVKESRAAAERELERAIDPAWNFRGRIVRATAEGTPFLEIIRYARSHEIDLIVLGTHGRTGVSHFLMGSVAEKVVRKADCPVLTVKPREAHAS